MKKVFIYILFFIVFLPAGLIAGGLNDFFHLSRYEKWWVFTHPFVAHKAYQITKEAKSETEKMIQDSTLDHDRFGGQIDAFRHCYWMARLAQNMKVKKAIRLGKAHEKANYLSFRKNKFDEDGILPDSVSGAMDLFNNNVGVAIGCNFRGNTIEEIKVIIIKGILEGKMMVILKNEREEYLECNGKLISNEEKHRWGIPKCMVHSNHSQSP